MNVVRELYGTLGPHQYSLAYEKLDQNITLNTLPGSNPDVQ